MEDADNRGGLIVVCKMRILCGKSWVLNCHRLCVF